MNGWPRWAIYTAAVWAGALIISLAVAELREPDLGQIESDLREIKAAQPGLVNVSGTVPTPYTSTTPIPGDTVELKVGTEIEYLGARYTVAQVMRNRVEFTLEGPHPGGYGHTFKVIDEGGFVCEAGIRASPGVPLAEGEKARLHIEYSCKRGNSAEKLLLDGMTFEVP